MAKKHLVEEIRDFRRAKKILVPVLFALGALGLFLPLLPGVACFFLGYLLLFPQQGENFLRKIRAKFEELRGR